MPKSPVGPNTIKGANRNCNLEKVLAAGTLYFSVGLTDLVLQTSSNTGALSTIKV